MNIKKIINSNREKFTKSDEAIASYFLEGNAPTSARDLATNLHISQSSISRFVAKIGIKNYETFIYQYENERNNSENVDIKSTIFDAHVNIIENNYEVLDHKSIENLVDKIDNNKVLIIAKENTALACIDFAKRINRFGNDVRVAKTNEEIVIEMSQLKENDVVIFVSISGISNFFEKQLLKIPDNIYVFGMTSGDSSLIKYSNDYIPLFYNQSYLLTHSISYLLPLVIIFDNIYISYFEKASDEQHETRNQIINKILSE